MLRICTCTLIPGLSTCTFIIQSSDQSSMPELIMNTSTMNQPVQSSLVSYLKGSVSSPTPLKCTCYVCLAKMRKLGIGLIKIRSSFFKYTSVSLRISTYNGIKGMAASYILYFQLIIRYSCYIMATLSYIIYFSDKTAVSTHNNWVRYTVHIQLL